MGGGGGAAGFSGTAAVGGLILTSRATIVPLVAAVIGEAWAAVALVLLEAPEVVAPERVVVCATDAEGVLDD